MGSVVSAKAADERAAQKRMMMREKREKRRKRRFMKRQSQKFDSLKYDEAGALFYVNDNDEKIYIDDYGNEYYLDETNQPYYLDEKGEQFYLDDNSEPYYLEEGTKYFLDTAGRKYYFDENGEPIIASTHDDDNVDDENVGCKTQDGMNSRQDDEDFIELNGEELRLRAPVTPPITPPDTGFKSTQNRLEETTGTSFCLSRRNYTPRDSNTQSFKSCSECKPSVEIIDHRDGDTASFTSEENPTFDSTLSSYSTLSFMRSEYEMVISNTPDYVKDTSKESETRITAQLEAETKMLNKLLNQEKERQILPAGRSFSQVGTFNVKTESDTKDCIIVDSIFLSNGNIILADGSNFKFKQFNENLEYINSLDIDERPYGLCGWKDDIIHATFQSRIYDGIKVLKATISAITVTKTVRITSGVPYGIARSHQGLAVVISSKDGWQIHLMTLQGQISRVLKLDNEGMKPLMSPHYIIVTNKLIFFVSDRGSNSVYSFNTNGKILSEYKQLREPLGICSDNQGSLFVASPGVVHQISETGERIKALMRRETTGFAPVSVCYDPQDCLLVLAGKSNTVIAFEMND